jgi:hypothetical protein
VASQWHQLQCRQWAQARCGKKTSWHPSGGTCNPSHSNPTLDQRRRNTVPHRSPPPTVSRPHQWTTTTVAPPLPALRSLRLQYADALDHLRSGLPSILFRVVTMSVQRLSCVAAFSVHMQRRGRSSTQQTRFGEIQPRGRSVIESWSRSRSKSSAIRLIHEFHCHVVAAVLSWGHPRTSFADSSRAID